MVSLLLCLITSVLGILVYVIINMKRLKDYPPGPKWWPMFDNFLEIKKLNKIHGGVYLAFQKLCDKYKTKVLGLKLGGDYVIVATTYPLVQTVLSSDVFQGRPDNFFLRTRCMGTLKGIVCLDGPIWAEQRNFVDRHIRRAGYGKKIMNSLLNEELDGILAVLDRDGPDIEFEPIFSPFVIDIVWTLLTGIRLGQDNQQLQNLLSMLKARSKAFDMTGGTLNQFPWLRFIMPEKIGYNLLLKLNLEMKNFFMDTLKAHYDTWYSGREDNLIYSYITEIKQGKQTFNDEQLMIIFWDLFLGSSQTNGATMSFIMLMMLLHPEKQEKAFKEVSESLNPNDPISYSDRTKVPYIEAIMHEVTRLYPIAGLAAPRRVLRDTILDGYHIPKDSTLYANIYSVHHDEEYWGDPQVFRPERFLDAEGCFKPSKRVIPFGLGKRRCLGELLARQCVFIFFVGILKKYQICPVPNTALPSAKAANDIFLSPQKYKTRLVTRLSN